MNKDTLAWHISQMPRHGKKEALVYKTGFRTLRTSYRKLYANISRTVQFLEKQKLKKGDKVMLWGPNSTAWVTIFLACAAKGVVVVPIDVNNKIDFVKKIQEQVKAKAVFQTKYRNSLKIKTFFIEDFSFLIEDYKHKVIPDYKIKETDLVEIVYTSGTTGKPKGVMLSNRNLCANLHSMYDLIELHIDYRFLSVLPLSHLFEQMGGLLAPLFTGATVVHIHTIKPSTIFETMNREKINVVMTVPRLLEAIKKSIESEIKRRKLHLNPAIKRITTFKAIRKALGGKFKYFVVGGAALDFDLEMFWENYGIPLMQGYGLTETSPVVSCNTPHDRRYESVGRIVPGVNVRVMPDEEILVNGDNVFQGYYKNKQETKKAFSGKWFKTGDLGYFDQDGFLYIKGRKKDMIATKEGINIYPEDIESVLNNIKGVKDSCVVGIKDEVHAVLLTKEKNLKKIIDQANKHLNQYQQIRNYHRWPLQDFPRTSTMKVRKFIVQETLKKKKKQAVSQQGKLYQIISKVTQTNKKITAGKRLTDLGLTSIGRVELLSLIEQEYHIDLDEDKITKNTTVGDLEDMIKKARLVIKRYKQRLWTMTRPFDILRMVSQGLIFHPFVKLFSWPKIIGKGNLKGLKGPVIFMSNHQSHFDAPLIISALPYRFSINLCPATWMEYFFDSNFSFIRKIWRWFLYQLCTIFYNVYLFPQSGGFRQAIKFTGELLDHKKNILFFPEGHRRTSNIMSDFEVGSGLMGAHMKVPIVPIKVEDVYKVLPRSRTFPRFGRTTIKIGKPLKFKEESYVEITKQIQKAVNEL